MNLSIKAEKGIQPGTYKLIDVLDVLRAKLAKKRRGHVSGEQIIEMLKRGGVMRLRDICKMLNVSCRRTEQIIAMLVAEGKVEKKLMKGGRRGRYCVVKLK